MRLYYKVLPFVLIYNKAVYQVILVIISVKICIFICRLGQYHYKTLHFAARNLDCVICLLYMHNIHSHNKYFCNSIVTDTKHRQNCNYLSKICLISQRSFLCYTAILCVWLDWLLSFSEPSYNNQNTPQSLQLGQRKAYGEAGYFA